MADFTTVLQFICSFEQSHPIASAYEIANRLRGYTKSSYTTEAWSIVTGFAQPFIEGKLDQEITFAGEATDFGHFVASLSDQINQSGLQWADFTHWTGDYTAWAGDVGSAIELYRSPSNKLNSLSEALDRFASDSDYVADIAAYIVAALLNGNAQMSLSQALQQYHAQPYSEHIKSFIQQRFNGIFQAQTLINPGKVEADIRNATFAYLELSQQAESLKQMTKPFTQNLRSMPKTERDALSADLLQGSLHFMSHLRKKGNLTPMKFKPYRQTQLPWLGTVSYEVSI
ncbi:MAG TPA: hypothetical protein VL134_02695 [Leptolyngbya sp.]|jgi:hypothetical protein|nr:hypothetical protein [Leptolyngbya sp.]